jgi:hypothetical protein
MMQSAALNVPPEITTIGDVSLVTGMGSISTLTVGLLAALYGYRNRVVSSRLLAEQACQIEIDVLGKPIGRQDQYAAGFGGLRVGFPETPRSMKPFTTAKRLVFDRILQRLLCFDLRACEGFRPWSLSNFEPLETHDACSTTPSIA